MSDAGATVVRPRPSDHDRAIVAKRAAGQRYKFPSEPSDGWWERGALIVDRAGAALIDADGARRAFPAWMLGGWLIYDRFPIFTGGPIGHGTSVFVAAPTVPHQVVLQLPYQGFDGDDIQAFAGPAGFVFGDTLDMTDRQTDEQYPGRRNPEVTSWTDAVFTRDDLDHRLGARLRRRMSHPLGGKE